MTAQWQSNDAVEPFDDVAAEQLANARDYGVVSGCAVTLDSGNMTWDVAAGVIIHNGLIVTVAAQTNVSTISADSTNPEWVRFRVNGSGTASAVTGTPAAPPAKPDLGDFVEIHTALVAANETILNNATLDFDKRLPTRHGMQLAGRTVAEGTISNGSAGDVVSVTLDTSIPRTVPFIITLNWRKSGVNAAAALGLTLNSTVCDEAAVATSAMAATDTANDEGSGALWAYIGPRTANYLGSGTRTFGFSDIIAAGVPWNMADNMPTATITVITIRGISHASDVLGVADLYVWALR